MSVEFISLDTGSALVVPCVNNDDKTAIVLTGATVVLRYQIDGGTLQTANMTIDDAVNGIVRYQFGDNEISLGSVMVAETQITDEQGKVITQLQPFVLQLRKRLS